MPQAIRAFLESTDYENAVRLAISLGGDSDTLACITGGIAQAFYGGVPSDIEEEVYFLLNDHLAGIVRRAYASPSLHFTAGTEDFFEKLRVQGRCQPFAGHALFARMLFQQRQR